jgi:hypothetical protein
MISDEGRTVETFQAPRVSMTRPPPLWRSLLRQLSIPLGVVATGMVVGGIVTHNSAMIFGGLAPIPFAGVLFAIELPLIRLAQQRRRARVLRSSPAGTLFVAAATLKTLVRPAGDPSDSSPPPDPRSRAPMRNGARYGSVSQVPHSFPRVDRLGKRWSCTGRRSPKSR